MFDIRQDEHPGLAGLLERIDAEDRGRVRDAICETVRNGGSLELEFCIATPQGTTRWIATRGEVERRQSGSALLRAVSGDISERKRVEQEVARQRDELAHLSRVASLGEMAGSLAHEINQPLMAILSNARAAQRFMGSENPDLAELRAIVADIVEDDKRAGEVIHRLRALLRKGEVQRGKGPCESGPYPDSEVLVSFTAPRTSMWWSRSGCGGRITLVMYLHAHRKIEADGSGPDFRTG